MCEPIQFSNLEILLSKITEIRYDPESILLKARKKHRHEDSHDQFDAQHVN